MRSYRVWVWGGQVHRRYVTADDDVVKLTTDMMNGK
jgi:hypothetical protein